MFFYIHDCVPLFMCVNKQKPCVFAKWCLSICVLVFEELFGSVCFIILLRMRLWTLLRCAGICNGLLRLRQDSCMHTFPLEMATSVLGCRCLPRCISWCFFLFAGHSADPCCLLPRNLLYMMCPRSATFIYLYHSSLYFMRAPDPDIYHAGWCPRRTLDACCALFRTRCRLGISKCSCFLICT